MTLKFMELAFKEAQKAKTQNEVPVGAVIVDFKQGKVIASSHNKCVRMANMLMHAEILAINEASKNYQNGYLNDCDIYITLEPCNMCYHALFLARIRRIYFSCSRTTTLCHDHAILEKLEIYDGFSEDNGKAILREFFHDLRQNKKAKDFSF
jgi:tRNA(adenine34) deaminase